MSICVLYNKCNRMHTIYAISESRCILAFQQTLRGHVAATNQEANFEGKILVRIQIDAISERNKNNTLRKLPAKLRYSISINSVAVCTFQDNIRHMRINVVLQTKQEAAETDKIESKKE